MRVCRVILITHCVNSDIIYLQNKQGQKRGTETGCKAHEYVVGYWLCQTTEQRHLLVQNKNNLIIQ